MPFQQITLFKDPTPNGYINLRLRRIDPFSEIDGLASKQNPELRNELNHRFCKLRNSEQRIEIIAPFRVGRKMESLAPSGRSSKS